MAKAVQTVDKPKTGNETPVFKLENDGDKIKGEVTYVGIGRSNYGDGRVVALTIKTAEGPFRVYGRGTLDGKLREVKPREGDNIEIERIGEKVSESGNTYIKYTVKLSLW